jgi:hypothetical protein
MKSFKKIYVLLEKFGDNVKPLYQSQGIDDQIIDNYIAKFDIIRKSKPKELFADIPNVNIPKNQRQDISVYKNFQDLENVVDYVKGQKQLEPTKDIDTDVKPIYENDEIAIYRGMSPHECIAIRGSWPYTWCIAAQGSNNMFNTYRYKPHEPTFYFVKDKKFIPTNKYHFFVLQVTKNNQYIVTSLKNDGDVQMTWDKILQIQPKLQGLQHIFKNIPITTYEKELYDKFSSNITDEEFKKFDYNEKRMFLDMVGHKKMTDFKFQALPDDLKNFYISFGLGLTDKQYEMIQGNKTLLKRYREITERKINQIIEQNIPFDEIRLHYTEYLVLDDTNKKKLLDFISTSPLYSFILLKIYTHDVTDNLDSIPQELIKGVAASTEYSYFYMFRMYNILHNLEKIPQEVIKSVSKDIYYSYMIATHIIRNNITHINIIPREIYNTILSDPKSTYQLMVTLTKNFTSNLDKIPQEFIKTVSTEVEYSYFYMVGIYKATHNFDKIPQEIIKRIITDRSYSLFTAFEILKIHPNNINMIPRDIYNVILSSSSTSYDLIYHLIDNYEYNLDNIPSELLLSISKDSLISWKFASNMVNKNPQNVEKIPDFIFDSIADDSTKAWDFAYYLRNNFEKIPKVILNSISKSNRYSFELVKLITNNFTENFDKVPKNILKTAINYSPTIKKYFSIKNESKIIGKFEKKYKRIVESFS